MRGIARRSGTASSRRCWRRCSGSAGSRRPRSWSGRGRAAVGALCHDAGRGAARDAAARRRRWLPISPSSCGCARRSPMSATGCAATLLGSRMTASACRCSSKSGRSSRPKRKRRSKTSASAPRARPPSRQSQGLDRQARTGSRQRRARRAGGRAREEKATDAGPTSRRSGIRGGWARPSRSLRPRACYRYPSTGCRIQEFGAADGLGGTEKGLSIATRPGAQVTAPCDGWVVYAGHLPQLWPTLDP